jgi:predicted protein tyrosine phosphatase
MNVLFICSRNRLRSPTAEHVFADYPGIEVASAGLNRDAEVPLTEELLSWADIVFVMEQTHRERLNRRFGARRKTQRLICLDIPDRYPYMDEELVDRLKKTAGPFLIRGKPR